MDDRLLPFYSANNISFVGQRAPDDLQVPAKAADCPAVGACIEVKGTHLVACTDQLL